MITGRCVPSWKNGTSATCWRSPAITSSPPLRAVIARMPWPGDCLGAPGSGSAAVTAPGAPGRYAWALVSSGSPQACLLIRRSITRPPDLAFYLWRTPRPVSLGRLVTVAGTRWAVDECFQAAKNEAGMDHYQVRVDTAWYRYVTLAMFALAFLVVTRAALADDSEDVISSANEIRRVFTALCGPLPDEPHIRHWSRWRHRHQQRARQCHYQQQRLKDH